MGEVQLSAMTNFQSGPNIGGRSKVTSMRKLHAKRNIRILIRLWRILITYEFDIGNVGLFLKSVRDMKCACKLLKLFYI